MVDEAALPQPMLHWYTNVCTSILKYVFVRTTLHSLINNLSCSIVYIAINLLTKYTCLPSTLFQIVIFNTQSWLSGQLYNG